MKKLTPILQSTPPNDRNVLWADNSGDNISIKVWDNGKWKEIYSKPSPKVTTKIKERKFLEKEYIGEYTSDEVEYNHLIQGKRISTQLDIGAAKVSDTCNVSLYYTTGENSGTSIYEGDSIIQEYVIQGYLTKFLSSKILTQEEVESFIAQLEVGDTPVETDLPFIYMYLGNYGVLLVNRSLLDPEISTTRIGLKAKVKDGTVTITTDYETPVLITLTPTSDDSSGIYVSDTPVSEIVEAINKGIPVVGELLMPEMDLGIINLYGTFSNMRVDALETNCPTLHIESPICGVVRVLYNPTKDNWICYTETIFQPLYLISTGVSGKYRAYASRTPKETDTPHMFGEDFFNHYYLMYPDKVIKFYDSGDERTSFSGIVHKTDGNVYIRTFKLMDVDDPSSPDYNKTLEQHDFLIGNTDTQM